MIAKQLFDDFTIEIDDNITNLEEAWIKMQSTTAATNYQGYDWVRIATQTLEAAHALRFIFVHKDQQPCFILPLVCEKGTPGKVRWPGDTHANIGEGLYANQYLQNPHKGLIAECFKLLAKTIQGPAILNLKNQRACINGYQNPMLDLTNEPGPNALFAMDLRQGFETLLANANGKRKRKSFRHQCRVAEKMGGYEFYTPAEPNKIRKVMDLFFELKGKRLQELGVCDVFDSPETKAMLTEQALSPEQNGWQPMRLYVLEVGGIIRGIYGIGIAGKHASAQFNAIRWDDFANESPGEMMVYLMVQDLIEQGFEYFDLGIGHERYKRSWCKQQYQSYETIYPLSTSATPFVAYQRYQTRLKRHVKSNDFVWSKIKRIRKMANEMRR